MSERGPLLKRAEAIIIKVLRAVPLEGRQIDAAPSPLASLLGDGANPPSDYCTATSKQRRGNLA